LERENQRISGLSEDHRESMAAFREKRQPKFQGR
jgi:enoyl-CoA hydratase/carnithine racemase